jgi:hypothetical protein
MELQMTSQGRLLKVFCLAALFAGIGSLVYGVALAVGNFADIDAWVTTGEGLLSSVLGVRTAILANVPSNTAKIKSKYLIAALAAIAVIAYLAYSRANVQIPQLALAAIVCVIVLAGFFIASSIVKEQLRK